MADYEGVLRKFIHEKAIGHSKPERIGNKPGRRAREIFETNPSTRSAARDYETGRTWRGGLRAGSSTRAIESHGSVTQAVLKSGRSAPRNALGTRDKHWDVEFGFSRGREGKFVGFEDMAARGQYTESIDQNMKERYDISEVGKRQTKANIRADSEDFKDQYRRNKRGKGLLRALTKTKAEMAKLAGSTTGSPGSVRYQQLVRRYGNLKNIGRRAGFLGANALAGSAITPFESYNRGKAMLSGEKDRVKAGLEHFLGLPAFSTGRSAVPEDDELLKYSDKGGYM